MSLSVSAIIPTFNRAGLLVEAIDSVLRQTRVPEEIVVVDDGSTDNTEQVVSGYGGRVRYIRQTNAGPAAARNRGIREASSQFIALLDSDDLWEMNRLASQLAVLATHPELDVLFGLESKFTHEAQHDGCEIKDRFVLETLNSATVTVTDPFGLLVRENFIPTSSVLFRKDCIPTVGLIDESLPQAEDYDFWLRFALHGYRFGFVNGVMCYRRQHEGNLVNQWVKRTSCTAAVLSRYVDHSAAQRDCIMQRLSELYYDLGSRLFYDREFDAALHYLRQAKPAGRTRLFWHTKLTAARWLRPFCSSSAQKF